MDKNKLLDWALSSSPASAGATTLTESLIDKFILSSLPKANELQGDATSTRYTSMSDKPALSIQVLSRNFRNFQARASPVYELYHWLIRLYLWKQPSCTWSLMTLYTLVCLNPKLISTLPFFLAVLYVLLPAYVVRHPPAASTTLPRNPVLSEGPPLHDAPSTKPVPEVSQEFYMNVVDTQNILDVYVQAYDLVAAPLQHYFLFADEYISCLLCCVLLLLGTASYWVVPLGVHYLPLGEVACVLGWTVIATGHPVFQETTHLHGKQEQPAKAKRSKKPEKSDELDSKMEQPERRQDPAPWSYIKRLVGKVNFFAVSQFMSVEPHEQREVEIYEIQQFTEDDQWGHSYLTTDPWLANGRGQFPAYSLSMQSIQPPQSWCFATDKWTLDYEPEHWTRRYPAELLDIDDAEKWVYDRSAEGARLNVRRRRWTSVCTRQMQTKS